MQTLSIIGAGRLGRSIARLAGGHFRIAGVVCRSMAHARDAVDFIGAGTPLSELEQLPPSDLYLLSVPDDVLAATAAALAVNPGLKPRGVVFHASGALDVALLAPLAARGMRVGSLHPAFSFADPARALDCFTGTLCALEGDDGVSAELASFAAQIGARSFRLTPGGKAAYHAALSMASNFLVTLTGLAEGVAARAGVAPELAVDLLGGLMRQTLDNALSLGPAAALTGPIARGDAATVARHLAVLTLPAERACYVALARATLELARPGLSSAQQRALGALLERGGGMSEPFFSCVVR